MKARGYIYLSGFIWSVIGVSLYLKGTRLLSENGKYYALFLGISLAIAYLKARFVLSKTVQRCVNHLSTFPGKINLVDAYQRSYLILMSSMIALGMCFRFFHLPTVLHGIVDATIGMALILGSVRFFRAARDLKAHL